MFFRRRKKGISSLPSEPPPARRVPTRRVKFEDAYSSDDDSSDVERRKLVELRRKLAKDRAHLEEERDKERRKREEKEREERRKREESLPLHLRSNSRLCPGRTSRSLAWGLIPWMRSCGWCQQIQWLCKRSHDLRGISRWTIPHQLEWQQNLY